MAFTREGFLENNQHRIALFLDFENLVTNTGFTAGNFDLQPAMDRLLERGKVVFRRAYCDWSRFKDAKGNLHEFGVELIDVPPSTRSGKNGADMRLVIDALELCYAREHIDTFAIASGDSDFCPLAYKLRENGKQLIGLAVKEATSPLFVKACDEFIYLRPRTRAEKDKEKRAHEHDEAAKGRGGKHGKGHGERQGKEPAHGNKGKAEGAKTEVPESVVEVVQRLLARTTGTLNPSLIKEALVRKEPDFDERDHGFSSFTKLLSALEHEGVLKRVQQGRQWYVVAPDAAPLEPSPESKGRGRAARPPVEEEDEEEVYPDPVDDF